MNFSAITKSAESSGSRVGFPRDERPGTNRDGTSRCPFVPGQKNFLVPASLCPGVPLSQDKGRSKCPGTNPSVSGRPVTK